MAQLRALAAVLIRNLRIALRRPDLLVQTIAVPVVVLGLASIIFGATDAWPIAVVDKADNAASHKFIQALNDTRGATGPYFRVVENDPEHAANQLRNGRLQLIITIPAEFERSRSIDIATYNINTDAMKNVRLRVSTTANVFDGYTNHNQVSAIVDKVKLRDVTRQAFMGGSAVILALLLGAALIAANLYAVETEHRSGKEIGLTPLGSQVAGLGAAVAGWALSFLTMIPTLLLALAFGTRAEPLQILYAATIVVPAGAAAAGLCVCAAAYLRTHRHIQPLIILLGLGTYFASGGFMPVSALPPLARAINTWWPPSYVFEWANPLLHAFGDRVESSALAAVVAAGVACLTLAAVAARRESRIVHAQGQ